MSSDDARVALGALAVPVEMADDAAPAWIKIAPAGRVETRDGRSFSFDPEKLAARFEADGIDVPIDLDHAIGRSAETGRNGGAVGWIKEFQARADGLYGRVEWLEGGRQALAAKSRRYVSPSFTHAEDGSAVWIHSVALVAAPALSMPALAGATLKRPDQEPEPMKAIAKSLGLIESADETACLSAITKLKDGTVSKDVHEETLKQLKETSGKLAELEAGNRKKEVDAVLEAALKAKKIVPSQKEHYAELCATDQGLAQVKALLEATPEGLKPTDLDAKKTESGQELDAAALAAKAKAHQNEMAAKGVHVPIEQCVAHVQEK